MKARWISIAAAALVLVAAIATAQPLPNAHNPGGPRAGLVAYLQLTPDQITAWQQIHKDTAAAIKPLASQARDLRTQLEAAVKAGSPDPVAIGKLTLALRSVREQVRAARDESKTKLLAVLTPEQKTKFEAFEAARGAMRHRRGH
jgi:Spy/CpxP family protein refolding chaperone